MARPGRHKRIDRKTAAAPRGEPPAEAQAPASGRGRLRVVHGREEETHDAAGADAPDGAGVEIHHRRAAPRAAAMGDSPLERLLELLERRRLSPIELRVLLAVRDRDAGDREIAAAFGRRALEIRRAAARLYARGFVRWRDDRERGEVVLGITRSGLATLRPLLTAVRDPGA